MWKSQDKRQIFFWVLSLGWLCLIGGLAFFWNLGNIGLIDETEPLFAEAARQMTVTGDWITPYFNGETRFDKPPLIYWLMAIAYQTIGVNEWAVRLPSAVAAIALVSFGFYILYRYGHYSLGDRTSRIIKNVPRSRFLLPWIGAATMAFNPEMITWGRIGVSDMLLAGCMCSALLAFFSGYATATKSKNSTLNKWYLAFYILSALAVLTKGPVGIVLPVLIIGSFLLYVGKFREVWQEIYPLRGSLIFIIITLPWYVLVTIKNGSSYIESFFGYHNFERFTSVVNHHAGPWYFYFLVVLFGFAPWSIYLPVAIAQTKFWQRRYWSKQPRESQLGLFALFWFTCIFIFFTIASTKLISYVLPLMPAAAILAALFWGEIFLRSRAKINYQMKENRRLGGVKRNPTSRYLITTQVLNKKEEHGVNLSAIFNVILLLVLALAIPISYQWLNGDPAMPNFGEVIKESGLLVSGSFLWGISALVIAFLLAKRQIKGVLIVNFIGIIAFFIVAIMPTLFLADSMRQLPLRELAETIVKVRQPGEEVVMIAFEKPSLVFYTQKPVNFFRRATNAREFLEKISQYNRADTVLIIGYPRELVDARLEPNHYQYLDGRGAYVLSRVPKEVFLEEEGMGNSY